MTASASPERRAKEPRFLAAHEVEALARATRPPYDLLIRFAAATGLRPSELRGLRVGRLNLVKGTVEVAEGAHRRGRCGSPVPTCSPAYGRPASPCSA